MTETEEAIVLANRVLDRHSSDPDDDLAVLARQFLRGRERELERTRLRIALEPFVAHYETWMDEWPDSTQCSTFARVTFGQLRAARAALSGGSP